VDAPATARRWYAEIQPKLSNRRLESDLCAPDNWHATY
jgi:hypothetical protein